MREIDRRIRFLTKRLEIAEIVDSSVHKGSDKVFFGANVTYMRPSGEEVTVQILGTDEADSSKNEITWVSPVARAMLRASVGDEVRLQTPAGSEVVELLAVCYE